MNVLVSLNFGLSVVRKPAAFIEEHPILLFACLLMIIGTAGSWVSMPLSGELRLTDLQSTPINRQFKLVVLGFVGVLLATTALNFRLLKLVVAFSLTAMFISIAISLCLLDGARMHEYVTESQAFRDIQRILALNIIPNAGRSVETTLAFDAYYFSDRVKVALAMLGWGGKLSILISLSISLYCVVTAERKIFAWLLSFVAAGMLFVAVGLGNVSLAYLKLNQGVRAINAADSVSAMRVLNESIILDPALAHSPGFTLLHSYLYFTTFGPENPFAKYYQLEQRFNAGNYNDVFELNKLTASAERTQLASSSSELSIPITAAHIREEQQTAIEAHHRLGLQYLWRKQWVVAEQQFAMSLAIAPNLVAEMALLRIYQETKQYNECVAATESLLAEVHNKSISADVLSFQGECLLELGRPNEARIAFQESISLDSDKNYRAVKGLSGT